MSSVVPSLPASKEDVTVRLLTAFKWLISEGTLSAGARLPAERDLAEKFQVSRSSLRQALKVLEIMGVISQRVGDGTYITSGDSSVLAESLEFLILLNGISFHEVMEARIIVEPELAALAATRATQQDYSALLHEMKAMKASARSHNSMSQHDLEFHKIIFDAAGSRVCSMLFTVIHQSLHKLIEMTSRLVSVEHTMIFHQRIYAAIVAGDAAEARKRMSEHLLDVKNLLSRVKSEQQTSQMQDRISQLAITPPRARTRKR
jgi:GntR family transcriptional repressor for pyruvate dehydrogenase complex